MYSYIITFLFALNLGIIAANYYGSESIGNGILKVPEVEGKDILTWCTKSKLEQAKCGKLSKTVEQDKGLFGREFLQFRCKQAFDTEECMKLVEDGVASVVALDAAEVHVAGRYHSLVPIMQELYGDGEPYQYSVAVIKKGSIPSVYAGSGLRGLRGIKACFPSVGSLAGWVMPIHVLMQEGGMQVVDCNNHVKSAIAYFGESCAPNSLKDINNPIGDNSDKLCRLCTGGAGVRCTMADPYAGYEGALQCLLANGTGDIAFVKDTTVQHALLSGKILDGVPASSMELLCRDGSRAELGSWLRCHWGKVPADAIAVSSAYGPATVSRIQKLFKKLIELYGEPNPYNSRRNGTSVSYDHYGRPIVTTSTTTEYSRYPYDRYRNNDWDRQNEDNLNRASTMAAYKPRTDGHGHHIELPFKLFQSNGTTDLLIQDSTINLRMLNEEERVANHILNNEFVGDQAERAIKSIRNCPIKRATLCVTSEPEMEKCVKMRIALNAAYLSPTLVCWRAHSSRECERAIATGVADFALFDAGDMLRAAANSRIVPFMQEIYTNGFNWYYAVAVAKEQDADTDLTFLRGKNTCHTGIGQAAGWIYPLAYLISNGWVRHYGCDGAHTAAEYFSKSCVPGALSSEYVDSNSVPHDNLCHLCHGSSFRRCKRDASEDYYGHIGALRCMVEGGGDVAFVRHSAPTEGSAGRRRDFWARDLLPDDLQLLCPDGTRARIHEYERCNLGKVPGAVLMGRANHTELDAFSNLMVYAQQLYGADSSDDFSFSMFYSRPPYSDLIFSSSAVRLKPLAHKDRSAELIAGTALPRAARIVSCDAPQANYLLASDPDFLSHGYRTGVVGNLLAVAIFIVALLR